MSFTYGLLSVKNKITEFHLVDEVTTEEVAHNEKENVFTPEEEAECDQEVANIFARCDDEEIDEELNRLAKAALEAATNINDDSDFSIHGSDEVGKLSADGGDILTRNEEKNIDEDIIVARWQKS